MVSYYSTSNGDTLHIFCSSQTDWIISSMSWKTSAQHILSFFLLLTFSQRIRTLVCGGRIFMEITFLVGQKAGDLGKPVEGGCKGNARWCPEKINSYLEAAVSVYVGVGWLEVLFAIFRDSIDWRRANIIRKVKTLFQVHIYKCNSDPKSPPRKYPN